MLTLERVPVGKYGSEQRYRIINQDRTKEIVAIVEGFENAGCLLRFLKGARLERTEYRTAIDTMRMIDTEGERANEDE